MIDFTDRPGEVRHFIHKRIVRASRGFFTGGPVGAAAGFLGPRKRSRKARRSIQRTPPRSFRAPRRNLGSRRIVAAPGFRARLSRALPGGRTGLVVAAAPAGGGCPQGFHPNKSDYMTKSGFVAQGSKCVRNRRRNLSNGRANTRSLRRMAAWDKQERKLGATLKKIARGR